MRYPILWMRCERLEQRPDGRRVLLSWRILRDAQGPLDADDPRAEHHRQWFTAGDTLEVATTAGLPVTQVTVRRLYDDLAILKVVGSQPHTMYPTDAFEVHVEVSEEAAGFRSDSYGVEE